MNANPYKHLLNPNQPTILQQQEQSSDVNGQAQVYNTAQQNREQQQRSQCMTHNNLFSQGHFLAVAACDPSQNLQIQAPISAPKRITDKNSFMETIVSICMLQYILLYYWVCLHIIITQRQRVQLLVRELTGASFLDCIVFDDCYSDGSLFYQGSLTKSYKQIVVIVFLIIYTKFQVSLIAVCMGEEINEVGDYVHFGGYFFLGVIGYCMTVFNIIRLVQLTVLLISMRIYRDTFTLRQFQINGVLLSMVIGLLFLHVHIVAISIVSLGIIFIFWFSYGLARVSDENFGLKQDQTVFGHLQYFLLWLVHSQPDYE